MISVETLTLNLETELISCKIMTNLKTVEQEHGNLLPITNQ